MLYLFSALGTVLGLCIGVSLVSSSRSGVTHVSLSSIIYGETIFKLHCTRSVQFGVVVPSLMDFNVEKLSPKTTLSGGEI